MGIFGSGSKGFGNGSKGAFAKFVLSCYNNKVMVHESEGYFMGKLRPYLGDKPFYKKLITIALPITL
ncbi:MAG: hypothetical protein IKM59_05185, partial [Oscillospiraceae bacterium]|nr:hypothetical protein [Oscillospiraceae bacterium]